jgi:hypothetical protein
VAWLAPETDPDLMGHAQNQAWGTPADAVKAHRELQKLFGADRHGRTVTVPKDDDTPQVWSDYYEKLGRPKMPSEYALPVPEGQDRKFADAASAKFHELGLSSKQGKELAAWWNQHSADAMKAHDDAEQAALAAEHQQLQKDWGTGPDAAARREIARRAAVALGLDEQSIDTMEKSVGFSKVMKALAKVGDLMREGGAEGLDAVGSFGMTPEGARAKRAQLMADKEWRGRAMNPASKEWAELQKLDATIAGSLQQQ